MVLNSTVMMQVVLSVDTNVTTTLPSDSRAAGGINTKTIVISSIYSFICFAGLLGNGLVIFSTIRFSEMRTVTNNYIRNLAFSDTMFLIGLPFVITYSISGKWIFGPVMCKLFYIFTSTNWFTSVFTLVVMCLDRFVAVYFAVSSIRICRRSPMELRTHLLTLIICFVVWILSLSCMWPIISGSGLVKMPNGQEICGFPNMIMSREAFVLYGVTVAFAMPVFFMGVFYTLVIVKIRKMGTRSEESRRKRNRATRLVLTVIAVYVLCWLPYWIGQILSQFHIDKKKRPPEWFIVYVQFAQVLSYMNSMMNPIIYGFLSPNFRSSFIAVMQCKSLVNHHLNFRLRLPSVGRTTAPNKAELEELKLMGSNDLIKGPEPHLLLTATTALEVPLVESPDVAIQSDTTSADDDRPERNGQHCELADVHHIRQSHEVKL